MKSLQNKLLKLSRIILLVIAVAVTTLTTKTITNNSHNKRNLFHLQSLFANGFTITTTTTITRTRNTRYYTVLPLLKHIDTIKIIQQSELQLQIQLQQRKSSLVQLLSSSIDSTTTSTSTTNSSSIALYHQQQQQDEVKQNVLNEFTKHYNSKQAQQYTETYDFENPIAIQSFYSLFKSIRTTPVHLGLHPHSTPFVIKSFEFNNAITNANANANNNVEESTAIIKRTTTTNFQNYFTMKQLQKAVEDDFLDAARGSIDNRKGWNIYDVSQPRGNSFQDARMTYQDVMLALEKGTVIMNAAGAHIPLLAEPSLVCTDTTVLPCSLNLYITSFGKRTSAPPHTDKQDVIVIQTSGQKKWKVYSVPDPSIKPQCDIFSRGKMDDNLPLYTLESDPTCQLLIDTILYPGDVLFIPAGYPHTTSTVIPSDNDNIEKSLDDDNNNNDSDKTSIHLTLGIDHHIWELDYINARTIAYRRAGVLNKLLPSPVQVPVVGGGSTSTTPFTGKVNELPSTIRSRVLAELPLGLLDDDDDDENNSNINNEIVEYAINELEQINKEIDNLLDNSNNDNVVNIDHSIIKETILQLQKTGKELLNIHRDMYIAAINEGRIRDAEIAMMIESSTPGASVPIPPIIMTPERMQRLSLFRVKQYYDRIDRCKKQLLEWSYSGTSISTSTSSYNQDSVNNNNSTQATTSIVAPVLPTNWAYTIPLQVGDKVEAELAGAMFDATITTVSSNGQQYDVTFFDGDKEYGLLREQIKLLTPPPPPILLSMINNNNDSKSSSSSSLSTSNTSNDTTTDSLQVDTSKMTSKQLKRWKKEQQQK